ncbi:MAG: metallophosphoesterase [Phycisphaerae bacterium]|nr:metallophosphoesterase [Phycisphaerae bacterium]
MRRRDFIKNGVLFTGGIALGGCLNVSRFKQHKSIRFGISTDIHQDIMHDAEKRLALYLQAAEKQQVDFVIDLGDFCFAKESNDDFVNIWKSSPLKKHNVLGNHDMDICTKEDFMAYVDMPSRYYSFDAGEFHFIVLDPNNLKIDNKYVPYSKGNFYRDSSERCFVEPQQIKWLKQDLAATDKHCIVFSHQSFQNPRACKNQQEIRAIFEDENTRSGFNKMLAAFSGHDHTDYAREINNIYYIQINSMSNQWVGSKYQCPERFSDSINKKRPSLKYTLPYKDPLYAIVTIEKGMMTIEGIESEFIKPGPKELGLDSDETDKMPLAAKITDRKIKF